jgi:hypothetical protein
MKRLALALCLTFALLSGGTLPSSLQRTDIQTELAGLAKRGITYRMLNDQMVELTDPLSGMTRVRSLKNADESVIRSWAARRGIPILEINPDSVDTARYVGMYTYFTTIPLSNASAGPLVVGDVDRNGKTDCYGAWSSAHSSFESRAYEIDSTGTVNLRHNYSPDLVAAARQICDADSDSLLEVVFTSSGLTYDYGQMSRDSLPTLFKFAHERYEGGSPGLTGIYIGRLDCDNLTDFLYKGSEIDSSLGEATKVYVAEYNAQANNFVRVWSSNYGFPGVAGIGGFAVDDFDGNGRQDFVVAELISGKVFVTECSGDNSYEVVWQDSTPFSNLFYTTGGDVDGDGRPEFFVGAASSWITMYEADSVHHYSPRFLFHLVPSGFDEPTYLTSDVDGDGKLDLIIFASGYTHMFRSNADNQYSLWYFRHDDNATSALFYDIDRDGRKDILVSKGVNGVGVFTDVYRANSSAGISNGKELPGSILLSNSFPNPFNPATTITYEIPSRSRVTLKVFNLLGEEVATLVDGEVSAGRHSEIWNATGIASGVYFCRLQVGERVITSKLLLMR